MTEVSQTPDNTTFYIKRIIGILLLLAIAAVFLFSAYSKIYDDSAFDQFQWTFLDMGVNSMTLAGILARVFIGLECMLGLFLILHIFLRAFTYPATIAILSVFVIYLIVILVQRGNNGNCGCFGNKLEIKPLTELWHDLLMIAATVVLLFIYPIKPYKQQEWIAAVVGMAALVAPFVVNPLGSGTEPEGMYKAINMDALYKNNPAPNVELRKGKHIVAFLSLTCPHCRKAAYLLQIIHRDDPNIPIFLVLNGPASYQDEFFKQTHSQNVPHIVLQSLDAFLDMAGPSVPAIYWMNNGNAERKSNYYQLDPKYMKQWLRQ